jgi:hypothetical protein
MSWWFDDGMPGWAHFVPVVGTAVFWALVVLVVVAALTRPPRGGAGRRPGRGGTSGPARDRGAGAASGRAGPRGPARGEEEPR